MKTWLTKTLFTVGGFIVGGASGVFLGILIARKQQADILERMNDEICHVASKNVKLRKELQELRKDRDSFMDPIPEIQDPKMIKPNLSDLVRKYRGEEEEDDEPEFDEIVNDDFLPEADEWPKDELIFEIPINSVKNGSLDFTTIEYFQGDNTLIRPSANPLEYAELDLAEYLGSDVAQSILFEERNTIYVYNRYHETLYEVVIQHGLSHDD